MSNTEGNFKLFAPTYWQPTSFVIVSQVEIIHEIEWHLEVGRDKFYSIPNFYRGLHHKLFGSSKVCKNFGFAQ